MRKKLFLLLGSACCVLFPVYSTETTGYQCLKIGNASKSKLGISESSQQEVIQIGNVTYLTTSTLNSDVIVNSGKHIMSSFSQPTNGKFVLNGLENTSNIKIINQMSKTVFSSNVNNDVSSIAVDISKQEKGSYFILITHMNETSETIKMVLK